MCLRRVSRTSALGLTLVAAVKGMGAGHTTFTLVCGQGALLWIVPTCHGVPGPTGGRTGSGTQVVVVDLLVGINERGGVLVGGNAPVRGAVDSRPTHPRVTQPTFHPGTPRPQHRHPRRH